MRRAQRPTTSLETPRNGPLRTVMKAGKGRSAERNLLGVFEELLEANVGEGMVGELLDDLEGDRADVGAELSGLEHVDGAAHAGHQHLGVVAVVLIDRDDLLDELHALV